ncbi:hypothetical protein [Thermus scotoductus]|uniref:hypothetical protein n=1 Tax=Thermus scotoductus TaxID=37636 RepID=UPI003F517C01
MLLKKLAKEGGVVKVHADIGLRAEPGEDGAGVKEVKEVKSEAPPVQAVEE